MWFVVEGFDLIVEMKIVEWELIEKGYKLYLILVGGLNVIGVIGYVVCV